MISASAASRSGGIFDFDNKLDRLNQIKQEFEDPDIWADQSNAESLGRERARLESALLPLQQVSRGVGEAAELLEPCAPSGSSRIDAMAKLCDWGVPVRVKLKPVIPIRGWRESYAACLKELLTKVRPETLGFTTMIWWNYERLVNVLGTDRLDPEFVGVKATTNERLGFPGREEGMAAMAVASVEFPSAN